MRIDTSSMDTCWHSMSKSMSELSACSSSEIHRVTGSILDWRSNAMLNAVIITLYKLYPQKK